VVNRLRYRIFAFEIDPDRVAAQLVRKLLDLKVSHHNESHIEYTQWFGLTPCVNA
jgi:hypothetical protein